VSGVEGREVIFFSSAARVRANVNAAQIGPVAALRNRSKLLQSSKRSQVERVSVYVEPKQVVSGLGVDCLGM
jgi:hypothetical protein